MQRSLRWHAPPPESLSDLDFTFAPQRALETPFATVPLARGAYAASAISVGTLKARVRVSLGWQRFDNVRRQSLGLMIGGRGGGGGMVDGNGLGAGKNSSLR